MKYTGERCIPEFMANKIKIYQHHISRYNFALMYTRNKRVLDAACGCGFGTNLIYDVAEYVMGVDNDEYSIDYAQTKYNGTFDVMDLNIDFPVNNYDIVVSFETIEHLDNPDNFIKNVSETTQEFLFSIPIDSESKFHKNLYTYDSISELMSKYYDEIHWFTQKGLNITKGLSDKNNKYLLGYARK